MRQARWSGDRRRAVRRSLIVGAWLMLGMAVLAAVVGR